MATLDGRVAVVTGAGRGLGREYALRLAAEGARLVVNDLGATADGTGSDAGPAAAVVAEIKAAGGEAVANGDDVADWDGARRLVDAAVETFGTLDVLVNNAGILRDRTLANLTEAEWDAVVAVHLKGHAAPTHWAVSYWREQAKRGADVRASVVNTSSISGLLGNPGQANYSAAKAGIAALTLTAAREGARYGVRVNALAPVARTRLTLATPGLEVMSATEEAAFDFHHPANVAPLVAYLAAADCPVTGAIFHIGGNQLALFHGWELGPLLETDGRWEIADLEQAVPRLCADRPGVASAGIDPAAYQELLEPAVDR